MGTPIPPKRLPTDPNPIIATLDKHLLFYRQITLHYSHKMEKTERKMMHQLGIDLRTCILV